MIDVERRIQTSLEELDELFCGFYAWLAGQYDPRSGGFFYARSSMDSGEFEADLESTAMALSILERSGLLSRLPRSMREALAAFFQGKQDMQSGLFLDRDPNMRADEVMVARAMGFALRALRRLGASPRHPLPSPESAPDYMGSTLSYVQWLGGVDLRNSWRGCDLMMSANHFIERMPGPGRASFAEAARAYFVGIQDPETGLWGRGDPYTRVSGTFKMNMFYKAFGLPMPRVQAIYESLLSCLRREEARDMCWIRNPIDLLGCFRDRITFSRESWEEILGITVRNMGALLRGDGGFSREISGSPIAPNVAQVKEGEFYPRMPKPVPLGKGLVEGDMNAGTQALLIRDLAYEISGLKPEPLRLFLPGFEKMMSS